jgi:putative spermidine/putrescine transport system permease protein
VYLRLDPALREASMALGAGPVRSFVRVTLPLTMSGVIGALTLVYLLTTGAIVTPLLLGGPRHTMLGSLIYNNVFQLFNFPRAAAIALILTASALVVVLPLQWLDSRIARHMPRARD